MTELSKSQLNKIGDRLRKGAATDDDIRRLDEYRISFMPAFQQVLKDLRAMGLEPGGRPQKTTPSIVAKLEREKTRLSTMQDIAGCRVQVDDLLHQDRVANELAAKYRKVEVQDRRIKPSHGYRAVHVVAHIDDKPIEIQIRTELQHGWAVATEKLADVVDAGLKYGVGIPSLQEALSKLSHAIAELENHEQMLDAARHLISRGVTTEEFEAQLKLQQGSDSAVESLRSAGGFAKWLEQAEAALKKQKRVFAETCTRLKEIDKQYNIHNTGGSQ